MKKLRLILVVLFIFFAACSNRQLSSINEAKYIIEHSADFQEFVQYLSVESIGILSADPSIYKAEPSFGNQKNKEFVHVIIYKTKSNSFKLVLLNDNRPPEVIAIKEFQ